MEEWRDIEGYKGYQVSSEGNVKSLWGNKERILKTIKTCGYLRVGLYKDGQMKKHLVHRLVAKAFLPNPDNLPQVNHKDEDKTNNRLDNLEWCDRDYNNSYGTRNERISRSHINGKDSKKVLQLTLNNEIVAEWASISEVKRQTGWSTGNISACCRNKPHYNTYKGYKWKYKNG